ncbi:MAG: orotidine-5'-phosphate decarboxylase [Spirochaetia bacterium]|nr:orotidine-5'-phosphate decarboxylase [Spirochaetia bacterium]
MNMMMNQKNDFLIVALDFSQSRQALDLVEKLPSVHFYKVGMELFYAEGHAIIDRLKSLGKKVFLDLKINDIPKTVEKSVKKLCEYQPDYLTVFCNAGGVRAALEGSSGSNTKILNVTVLTSQASEYSEVQARTRISLEAGAAGVICSGLETMKLRDDFKERDFIIVNPGIRLENSAGGDDQNRVVTPLYALQSGATNIVVGRPITQSSNPQKTVMDIFSQIGQVE